MPEMMSQWAHDSVAFLQQSVTRQQEFQQLPKGHKPPTSPSGLRYRSMVTLVAGLSLAPFAEETRLA